MSYLDNLQEVDYERQLGEDEVDEVIEEALEDAFGECCMNKFGQTERETDNTIANTPHITMWNIIKGTRYENLMYDYIIETLYNKTGTHEEWYAWDWRINDLIREWEESKE